MLACATLANGSLSSGTRPDGHGAVAFRCYSFSKVLRVLAFLNAAERLADASVRRGAKRNRVRRDVYLYVMLRNCGS